MSSLTWTGLYAARTDGRVSPRTAENKALAKKVEQIHTEGPDKSYRRINDELRHDHNHGCTRRAKNPQYIAENLLNRQFHADRPNEKWLTDVTELKWYMGIEVHKLYLSAILDLYDRRIVAYVISERNDNTLVFKTFDKAVKANPNAHPLFHSDRGFQYTNRTFHHRLEQAGMTQSMSRVAHCVDNGPMEGFCGTLKSERYYGKRFTSKQVRIILFQRA